MQIQFLKMLFAILGSITGTFEMLDDTGSAAYNYESGAYISHTRLGANGVNVFFQICNSDRSGDNSFEFRCVMNTLPNERDARQFIAEFVDWYNAATKSKI